MSKTESMSGKELPCLLEALNVDCLIAILSASNSLADLATFIHASPVIFHSFLAAKSSILCAVMTNELGPAIRDALVMSLTHNIDMLAADTILKTLELALATYQLRLLADKPPWIPPQDMDTAVNMAKLTRRVLHSADLYTSLRIAHFRRVLDPPCADWDIRLTERRRVAPSSDTAPDIQNAYHFYSKLLGLFEGWEMEQVSEMSKFLFEVRHAFQRLEFNNNCSPRLSLSNPPVQPRDCYHQPYGDVFPRVPTFLSKMIDDQNSSDCELLCELMADSALWKNKLMHSGSQILWLQVSYRWLRQDYPGPPEAVLALLKTPAAHVVFSGDSPVDPPWAWVHTWNGRNVKRWGDDLLPVYHSDGYEDMHNRMIALMRLWRWLGLVFWDKDRAEELLKYKALEECTTGWLESYMNTAYDGWFRALEYEGKKGFYVENAYSIQNYIIDTTRWGLTPRSTRLTILKRKRPAADSSFSSSSPSPHYQTPTNTLTSPIPPKRWTSSDPARRQKAPMALPPLLQRPKCLSCTIACYHSFRALHFIPARSKLELRQTAPGPRAMGLGVFVKAGCTIEQGEILPVKATEADTSPYVFEMPGGRGRGVFGSGD
ncbi:hypothetical protein N0V88_006360 [Collariella sp. IMI 366227]|nr:hypothetical protein N0V88_006360 [Collariella sp. IMI 366227]